MSIVEGRTPHRAALLFLASLTYLILLVAAPAVANATTIHVDIAIGNDLGGNGTAAWPYQHITRGLADAVYGDTVKVAKGEYSPVSGETLPLVIPIGVTVQGDTTPWMPVDSLAGTVISGNDTGRMMEIHQGDQNTIVDGLLFTGNAAPVRGSAIYVDGGSLPGGGPMIKDCAFYGTSAPGGGAIWINKGMPTWCKPRIERCIFAVTATTGGHSGGAILNDSGQLTLTDSYFISCTAAAGGWGGAIRTYDETTIRECIFLGCSATQGGAVLSHDAHTSISESIFLGNTADFGGAFYGHDTIGADDTEFRITNCLFQGNSTGVGNIGSAIRINNGDARIYNCTLIDNFGSTCIAEFSSLTQVYNTILWDNDDDLDTLGGTLSLANSCVEDVGAENEGPGVIHSNPLLYDSNNHVRLLPASPCIDTASEAFAPSIDLEKRTRPVDGDSVGGAVSDMGAYERDPVVDRAAGTNRYSTAVKASEEHFDRADNVVLATGSSYPDALCAAPLAGAFGSPILLTSANQLPTDVVTEMQRLEVEKVYIIGGVGAVSESVANELRGYGYEVERLFGADRYATSNAVAQEIFALMGGPVPGLTAVVVRGDAFPDALSVSPFTYRTNTPILLTRPTVMPPGLASTITGLGVDEVIIVGGTGAVSAVVESDIDALIAGTPTRVAGANRYETSAAFARWVQAEPGYTSVYAEDFIGLAIGSNFPDALCGGAVCGLERGPLLLTGPSTLPASVNTYIDDYSDTLTHVQAFGGTGVLGDSVLAEARGLIP